MKMKFCIMFCCVLGISAPINLTLLADDEFADFDNFIDDDEKEDEFADFDDFDDFDDDEKYSDNDWFDQGTQAKKSRVKPQIDKRKKKNRYKKRKKRRFIRYKRKDREAVNVGNLKVLFVNSKTAKIYHRPQLSSPLNEVIERGDAVLGITKGRWTRIPRRGWIQRSKLSPQPVGRYRASSR